MTERSAVLFVPAFFIVVIAVAVYAHRNANRRRCQWRSSKAGRRGALVKYTCIACGQEAFRSNGPPRQCLAALPNAKL